MLYYLKIKSAFKTFFNQEIPEYFPFIRRLLEFRVANLQPFNQFVLHSSHLSNRGDKIIIIIISSKVYTRQLMLPSWLFADGVIQAVIIVLVIMLLIDTSLIRLSELIRFPYGSNLPISLFVTFGVVYAIGQFLILGYVRLKGKEIRIHGNLYLYYIQKLMSIVQYFLIGIIAIVILQILATSHYNTVMLTISNEISYGVLTSMMSLLAQRFFTWYKSNKNSVILLYGLSSSAIALNTVFTLIQISVISPSMPLRIGEQVGSITRFTITGSTLDIFNKLDFATSIGSFLLLWLSTAFLLRHYSQRIGRAKYWVIVSLPLIYFLIQFPALFLNLFATFLIANPTFYGILLTMILGLSNLSGGILFAVAFWTAGKNVLHGSIVRTYMIISAFGLILLFLSNQGSILMSTGGQFPPFGLSAVSLVGLSSYLILIGIYSSAISVSHDIKIRGSIRDSVEGQARLLGNIGTAQMEREVERKVIKVLKEQQKNMIEQTGVQPSISEEEIKLFLSEVINEIKARRSV